MCVRGVRAGGWGLGGWEAGGLVDWGVMGGRELGGWRGVYAGVQAGFDVSVALRECKSFFAGIGFRASDATSPSSSLRLYDWWKEGGPSPDYDHTQHHHP